MSSLANAFLADRPSVIALAIALLLAAALSFWHRKSSWLSHIRRKPLLTSNEAEFYRRLQRALPGHVVFPQVSFGALLTDDGRLSRNARWSVRARFDRKIADFVICDRYTLNVVALVELDDSTSCCERRPQTRCHHARRRLIGRSGSHRSTSPRWKKSPRCLNMPEHGRVELLPYPAFDRPVGPYRRGKPSPVSNRQKQAFSATPSAGTPRNAVIIGGGGTS
jgi:hypothetical protein